MTIIANNEVGMDLSDEAITAELAKKLSECHDSTLQIDLCGCILDYKASSLITDAAVSNLERFSTPRKLVLIFDVKFQERLFLKWLFLGSKRLGLDEGMAGDVEIKKRVIKTMQELEIDLTIQIVDHETKAEVHKYSYGQ
jgi:hypothetical protein